MVIDSPLFSEYWASVKLQVPYASDHMHVLIQVLFQTVVVYQSIVQGIRKQPLHTDVGIVPQPFHEYHIIIRIY